MSDSSGDGEGGSTTSDQVRHWLTNDVAYLGVLAIYMGVWAGLYLSGRGTSCGLDAGAVLALGVALAWGFGPRAVETWDKLQGDS